MKALITGATSGIGLALAKKINSLGYDLILVSRSKEELENVKSSLNGNVDVIALDLSIEDNLYKLYEQTKNKVDLLINNAGFGIYGEFVNTDLKEEMNLIDLNIKAYHILTKLYLKDMMERNSGRILNVSSIGAFEPGPLLSTYYASKSYVYSLTESIYEELRRKKSGVKISVLCPGPVNTNFSKRANVKGLKGLNPEYVAEYTIKEMFNNKLVIIPTFKMRLVVFLNRLLPRRLLLKISYSVQKRKKIK